MHYGVRLLCRRLTSGLFLEEKYFSLYLFKEEISQKIDGSISPGGFQLLLLFLFCHQNLNWSITSALKTYSTEYAYVASDCLVAHSSQCI